VPHVRFMARFRRLTGASVGCGSSAQICNDSRQLGVAYTRIGCCHAHSKKRIRSEGRGASPWRDRQESKDEWKLSKEQQVLSKDLVTDLGISSGWKARTQDLILANHRADSSVDCLHRGRLKRVVPDRLRPTIRCRDSLSSNEMTD
jgi:hypothetical protein